MESVARPDAQGRFGRFGGKYVPETLIAALTELETEFYRAMNDKSFQVISSPGVWRGGSSIAWLWGLLPAYAACPEKSSRLIDHLTSFCSPLEIICKSSISDALLESLPCICNMQDDFAAALKHYVGRESPLYHAERLSEHYRQ